MRIYLAGRRETLAVALLLEEAKNRKLIRAECLLIASRTKKQKPWREGQFQAAGGGGAYFSGHCPGYGAFSTGLKLHYSSLTQSHSSLFTSSLDGYLAHFHLQR